MEVVTPATSSLRGRNIPINVGLTTAEAERRLIVATLAHFAGDKYKTAKTLGISLKTLYNRLQEYRRVKTRFA